MVDRDAASAQQDRYSVAGVEIFVGHRADKDAPLLVVVIQHRPFMRTGNDHERAILYRHLVDADADGQQIIVGVGIEGPILVPFHRAAKGRIFEVELVAIGAQVGADQLADNLQHRGVTQGLIIDLMVFDRIFEPAQHGLLRRVTRFQVKDIGVLGHGARLFDKFVGHAA